MEKNKRNIWIDIQAFLAAYASFAFFTWNTNVAEWNNLERIGVLLLGVFIANIMQEQWRKNKK